MPRAVPAIVTASVLALSSGDILDVDIATIVAEIGVFLLLVAILRWILFRPLIRVLEARDTAIDGARAEAEAKMREAEARTAEYEEKLRAARARAAAERDALRLEGRRAEAELVEKIKAETGKAVEEGKARARQEAQGLRRTLDASTPALAAKIAARVLGRDPGAAS
jgi:F-type H+-transporting ATPase subunit b